MPDPTPPDAPPAQPGAAVGRLQNDLMQLVQLRASVAVEKQSAVDGIIQDLMQTMTEIATGPSLYEQFVSQAAAELARVRGDTDVRMAQIHQQADMEMERLRQSLTLPFAQGKSA